MIWDSQSIALIISCILQQKAARHWDSIWYRWARAPYYYESHASLTSLLSEYEASNCHTYWLCKPSLVYDYLKPYLKTA